MRGVAIGLVVLAHAGVPGLSAGFIGVDVFFVISGFLITGLLTQELDATGRVDYWAFFARRARRLAPAALLMIVVVAGLALWRLPAAALDVHLASAFWAVLWSSNLYFAFAGFDYFGAAANDSLFLHTWSLGVEEQFYLLWPLVVVVAWRLGGTGMRWLAGLSLLGFAASLAILAWDANAAYYLMPSRLWQLALGGLAYRYASRQDGWRHSPDVFGVIGVLLLGAAMWWIDGTRPYPGLDALLPTLGAACLLLATCGPQGRVASVLGSRALRLPGKVSYSWYLWHWPFLLFLPAMGLGTPGPWLGLGLVLASLLVSLASYAYVEQPFRRRREHPRRAVGLAVLACLVVAGLLQLAAWPLRGQQEHARAEIDALVRSRIFVPSIQGRPECDRWYYSAELVPCELAGPDDASGVLVFIGDSVGAQWLPAIEQVARQRGLKVVVLTKSACPIVDEPYFYERINQRFTVCEQWRKAAVQYVQARKPALVVIGSSRYPFSAEQWREGTRRMLLALGAPGRPVAVIAPTPLLGYHNPICLIAQGRLQDGVLVAPACTEPLAEPRPGGAVDSLRAAVASVPGTGLVEMNDLVCPDGRCDGLVRGHITFRDDQHLNAGYVMDLAPAFARRLEHALADGKDGPEGVVE
ncbi:hypothetical protein N788_06300 [Arenimonas donghaensis DSM 18148 = HO3-R19]|uniref:Acyltransferase 3 domain-containing protein n=1 Tax=Arenimonas donghaensis DSM 18148 = HO3-R19 TaxID=1121014 RepID=A0A087MG77_9GAMM|nr:hypothetical protein N788_06300 [Arenimonas donghaensis DSM 18148 = HO3-R19]